MNLILFKPDERLGFLDNQDYRAKHINNIIRSSVGDSLDFGIIGGLKGKIEITDIDDKKNISFSYILNRESEPLYPITLIIGTPRPPVAKRLLKDLATTGIKKIIMCATDLGEKTYLTSKLWRDNNYLNYIIDGGSQGETTLLPMVERFFSLNKALESIKEESDLLALDNINPEFNITYFKPLHKNTVICIGAERGFSNRERELLKEYNYTIFKVGDRVLRTETVCHTIIGSILTIKKLI